MKRRISALLLAFVMTVGLLPRTAWAAEGDITISSVDDLKALATAVNGGSSYEGKTVTLTADLDLDGENWTPIGNSSYAFQGTFDGGFHTIHNLTIDTSSRYCGLFGKLQNATIQNLGIENANVVSSANDAAALAGNAQGGTISRCYVTGTVKGKGAVSGILGSTHSSSYTTRIDNCYARVAIVQNGTYTDDLAGISGWNEATSVEITNSYSACTGEKRPIAGWSDGSAVTNSQFVNTYFDKTLSPDFSESSGRADLGKTSTELKTQGTFTGWDFSAIWAIAPEKNGGYPYLRGFTPGLGGAPGSVTVRVVDGQSAPVTDASVTLKKDAMEVTLSHEDSGVYSGVVTTSGATYDVYVNDQKVGTVTQTGSGAANVTMTAPAGETPIPAHSHAVSVGCETDSGTQVTFQALTSQNGALYIDGRAATKSDAYYELPAGNYYLAGDVTLDKTIYTYGGSSDQVNLCLNGRKLESSANHVITAGTLKHAISICDCDPDGGPYTITSCVTGETVTVTGGLITGAKKEGVSHFGSTTVTLYGGTIAGNSTKDNDYGGGVRAGTFVMHGGVLAHNAAKYGGGAYVEKSFTMTGGNIEHNWAYFKGGGVSNNPYSTASPPSMTLSGSAKITGNVMESKKTAASNLNLMTGGVVTIASEGLGENARIGISAHRAPAEGSPVTVAQGSGDTALTAADLAKFSSDNSSYELKLSNGKVVLAVKSTAHTHNWAPGWSHDATYHWHECTAQGCDVTQNSGKDGYAEHTKTWSHDAAQHQWSCSVCGRSNTGAHTWNAGVVTTPPTVDAEGVKTYTCTACQATKTETLPKLESTFAISGTVTDESASGKATVTLMRGSTVISTQEITLETRGAAYYHGDYSYTGVKPGIYNVVARNGDRTKTILVELANADAERQDIRIVSTKQNSVVEVKGGDTPAVVVGGVDRIAESESPGVGETVTVKLTVEQKAEEFADNAAKIKAVAGGQTLDFLELKLEKTVADGTNPETTTEITDTNGAVIEIVVPFRFSGKVADSVTVYRYHGDSAAALNKADTRVGGTFRLDTAGGLIHIYATKFSTYAIGYTLQAEEPPTPPSRPYEPPVSVSPAEPEKKECPRDGTCPLSAFPDADPDSELHDALHYCVEKGLFRGYDDGLLRPEEGLTRGMMVELLYNAAGRPQVAGTGGFVDVTEEDWYAPAAAWAAQAGVVKGFEDGRFAADVLITREQIIVMIYRYATYAELLVPPAPAKESGAEAQEGKNQLPPELADMASASWAYDAVVWAINAGLLELAEDNDLTAPITREQAAVILHGYLLHLSGN